MRRYALTRAAQADLSAIWDYTESVWDRDQAERYIRSIKEACEALARGQKVGRSASIFRSGYFRYAIGSHFIFYTLPDDRVMQVIRVLHQRMDIPSRLTE